MSSSQCDPGRKAALQNRINQFKTLVLLVYFNSSSLFQVIVRYGQRVDDVHVVRRCSLIFLFEMFVNVVEYLF